ncbi:unnamed protein product, partial [Hapterophycus canaliculatus]
MDFSLDDLLEEVEGALNEVSPRQKPCSTDASTRVAITTSTAESDIPLSVSSLFSFRQERSPGARAGGVMTAAPPSTVPTETSALDVDFDSDSSQHQTRAPGATTVGVDFNDLASPEIPSQATASGTIIRASFDTGFSPGFEAMPGPDMDADFDADSGPIGSTSPLPFGADTRHFHLNTPAEMAFAAAMRVDFDAVDPPAVDGTAGVGFDEDDELSSARTKTNGGDGVGDELPPFVSPGKGSTGDVRKDQPNNQAAAHDSRSRPTDGSESSQREQQHPPKIRDQTTAVPSRVCGEGRIAPDVSVREGGENRGGGVAATGVAATSRRRCGTVCLGGVDTERGYCASSLSQRACDNLRCTDCNFEVLRFDGRAWESRIDYMFLRNNAPDPAKLSARLQPCA